MKYNREAPLLARQAVINIQKKLYGPPPTEEAFKMANRIIKSVGLKGTSVERYWYLFVVCALMNKECNVRYWKERPETRKQLVARIAARAAAILEASKRREHVTNESI